MERWGEKFVSFRSIISLCETLNSLEDEGEGDCPKTCLYSLFFPNKACVNYTATRILATSDWNHNASFKKKEIWLVWFGCMSPIIQQNESHVTMWDNIYKSQQNESQITIWDTIPKSQSGTGLQSTILPPFWYTPFKVLYSSSVAWSFRQVPADYSNN